MDHQLRKDLLYTVVFLPNYSKDVGFAGFAKSVTSHNIEGIFDILPEHENFVSMVKDSVTIVDESGQRHDFALQNGLIEATNNIVKVFVEF